MNSSEEEKLAPITSDVIDNENKAERKKKTKYRFWIREIYKQRDKRFLFNSLEYSMLVSIFLAIFFAKIHQNQASNYVFLVT